MYIWTCICRAYLCALNRKVRQQGWPAGQHMCACGVYGVYIRTYRYGYANMYVYMRTHIHLRRWQDFGGHIHDIIKSCSDTCMQYVWTYVCVWTKCHETCLYGCFPILTKTIIRDKHQRGWSRLNSRIEVF